MFLDAGNDQYYIRNAWGKYLSIDGDAHEGKVITVVDTPLKKWRVHPGDGDDYRYDMFTKLHERIVQRPFHRIYFENTDFNLHLGDMDGNSSRSLITLSRLLDVPHQRWHIRGVPHTKGE